MPRPQLPPDFRVIPVIDVRGGVVVRATAGRREEYKPLTSCVTRSTDPLVAANDLREFMGTDELYVADLDGITHGSRALGLIEVLAADGFRLWVDAGVRDPAEAQSMSDAGAAVVIIGLETLPPPYHLVPFRRVIGDDALTFSLDLRNGIPTGQAFGGEQDPRQIVRRIAWAIRKLILLDLCRVGMATGIGTEGLCAWAKANYPDLELIVGGGVRGPEDLPRLKAAGASAALIASAIHDGKFGLPDAPL